MVNSIAPVFCLVAMAVGLLSATAARADTVLPGYKKVKHELAFQPSTLLQKHRLVAAPVAGFGGVREITADTPFRFSSKYGTRFYVIPADITEIPAFDKKLFSRWPNCPPPKQEISQVPITSPMASALTTLRFNGLLESGPEITIVSHVERDLFGSVASPTKMLLKFSFSIAIGLAICLFAIRRMKYSSGVSVGATK